VVWAVTVTADSCKINPIAQRSARRDAPSPRARPAPHAPKAQKPLAGAHARPLGAEPPTHPLPPPLSPRHAHLHIEHKVHVQGDGDQIGEVPTQEPVRPRARASVGRLPVSQPAATAHARTQSPASVQQSEHLEQLHGENRARGHNMQAGRGSSPSPVKQQSAWQRRTPASARAHPLVRTMPHPHEFKKYTLPSVQSAAGRPGQDTLCGHVQDGAAASQPFRGTL